MDRGRYIATVRLGMGQFWALAWALTAQGIRGRYTRSILGPLWGVINPVFSMVVFTFIQGFVNIPSDNIPYPIFAYSALLPWTFFASALQGGGGSLMGAGGILRKNPVAREVFVLVAIMNALYDLLISGVIMVGLMVWFRVPVGWPLLCLPALVLLTALLAFAMGMLLAAFGTFKQDFFQISGYAMKGWFMATPVIYAMSAVEQKWPQWVWLYKLNPMVGIIEAFRDVLIRNVWPDPALLAWGLPVTALALLIAWPLFRHAARYFADVL
jgi:lipopolysaccharide transport system permease protein